jgi:TnpA family transposase
MPNPQAAPLPRLADIGETCFWRIDPHADYGPLNGLARNRIDLDLIARNWDDMLRVAGLLRLGTVSASMLIRAREARRSSNDSGAGDQ